MLTDYRKEIDHAAKYWQVDPDLLEAVVIQESSGRADAFRFEPKYYRKYLAGNEEYAAYLPRRAGSSYGLCQIMFPTARQYGFRHEPEMLFLPGVNLEWGAKILSKLLARFGGDVAKALQAYNGGPGNVGAPDPVEYSRKVLAYFKAVRKARQKKARA